MITFPSDLRDGGEAITVLEEDWHEWAHKESERHGLSYHLRTMRDQAASLELPEALRPRGGTVLRQRHAVVEMFPPYVFY